MKNSVVVKIDWHGSESNQVDKTVGTGVIALVSQEDGDVLVKAVGVHNALKAMGVCLDIYAGQFDKQENQDLRLIAANSLDNFIAICKTTVDAMYEQLDGVKPRPVTPIN